MPSPFDDIPDVVIDYVRKIFGEANDKVTKAMSLHPSMYEESLDHILVMELTAAPPAFFSDEDVGVVLESHWLGSRRMFGRWEIADIALFVMLRLKGHLVARKVALLQTKRLYSREIPVVPVDADDYIIGIGRLADRTDQTIPLTKQRAFSFDRESVYQATSSGHEQVDRIDEYAKKRGIPVHYGFYNPLVLPYQTTYPALKGLTPDLQNEVGLRIMPADQVHTSIRGLVKGRSPSVDDITAAAPLDLLESGSTIGWRFERFVADEFLRCRQGKIFDKTNDPNLNALLYGRTAPIQAAITITIDMGQGSD